MSQDYLRCFVGARAEGLQAGTRFEEPLGAVLLCPTPLDAGGWFDRVWRVGSIEGLDRRWCAAMTPIERLDAREVFGARGDDVSWIIERLLTLTEADLGRIERRLRDDPALTERDQCRDDYPSVRHAMAGGSATTAVNLRVASIDPDAYTDDDFPAWRTWHRPVWPVISHAAADAIEFLALSADVVRTDAALDRIRAILGDSPMATDAA